VIHKDVRASTRVLYLYLVLGIVKSRWTDLHTAAVTPYFPHGRCAYSSQRADPFVIALLDAQFMYRHYLFSFDRELRFLCVPVQQHAK
jgi:hypothetical protein